MKKIKKGGEKTELEKERTAERREGENKRREKSAAAVRCSPLVLIKFCVFHVSLFIKFYVLLRSVRCFIVKICSFHHCCSLSSIVRCSPFLLKFCTF